MIRGFFYRLVMRVAHRYNWHYAPPVYPDGDTMLWCHWCGMRDVIKRREPGVGYMDAGQVESAKSNIKAFPAWAGKAITAPDR